MGKRSILIVLLLALVLFDAIFASVDFSDTPEADPKKEKTTKKKPAKGKAAKEKPAKEKSAKGAPKKEAILNGFTADTTHLPLLLKCDKSNKNVLLGSITIDLKPVDAKLLESAKKECKISQQMLSKGPSKERLQCSLELAAAKNLTGLEHVRAVYQCYQDSPEQWEVEKFVIATEKKAGKPVKMKCKYDKAMFKIAGVTINGGEVNTSTFPELNFPAIERECYVQNLNGMKAGSHGKGNYKCDIENKAEYGGTLGIKYWCSIPPLGENSHV